MPWAGLERTAPVFDWFKTVRILDHAATGNDRKYIVIIVWGVGMGGVSSGTVLGKAAQLFHW
jgi:hypothetical protein